MYLMTILLLCTFNITNTNATLNNKSCLDSDTKIIFNTFNNTNIQEKILNNNAKTKIKSHIDSKPFILENKIDSIKTESILHFIKNNEALESNQDLNSNQPLESAYPIESILDSKTKLKSLHNKTHQSYPPLPPDFHLTEEWIARFYDIATTTGESETSVGVCGACLLQAFQVIAELLQNHNAPPQVGGYFFDTGYHQDPFISFRNRNSILHDTLVDIISYYNYPASSQNDFFVRALDRVYASAISLLPQYNWQNIGSGFTRSEIDSILNQILNSQAGSIFILALGRYNPINNRNSGHAVAALRLQDGVIVVPANTPYLAYSSFQNRLSPLNSIESLEEMLTRFGSHHLELNAIGVLEVQGRYINRFENFLSVQDCSGDGDDRRGNGLLPLPELINQCISGRCEY